MGRVVHKPEGPGVKYSKLNLEPEVGQDVQWGSLALLKSLAEAAAVFIAFTFIGGWSYLGSYYSAFGLNPLELEVSVPVVCTTAIFVLYSAKWPLCLVAGLAILWIRYGRRLVATQDSGVAAVLVLLLLTVSTAGVFEGRRRAGEDSLDRSDALPYVSFASKSPTADQPSCVEFQSYGSFDCKLLLHTKSASYFFEPLPEVGAGSLNLYVLLDSETLGVHILRGLKRNSSVR